MSGAIYPQTPANVTLVNGHYGVITCLVSDLLWPSTGATILPVKDTPVIYKAGSLNIPGVVAADPEAIRGVTQPNTTAYTAGLLEYIAVRVSLSDLIYNLSVHGEDSAGNAAIARFDILYIDSDGELNADTINGYPYGIALAAVSSAATTKIPVKIFAPPAASGSGVGGGGLAAGLAYAISAASGATTSKSIAQMRAQNIVFVMSYAGAGALAIPGAANFAPGTGILVIKTGSAGAITITPASGTIGTQASQAATYVALDALNDFSWFHAVPSLTAWVQGYNVIA